LLRLANYILEQANAYACISKKPTFNYHISPHFQDKSTSKYAEFLYGYGSKKLYGKQSPSAHLIESDGAGWFNRNLDNKTNPFKQIASHGGRFCFPVVVSYPITFTKVIKHKVSNEPHRFILKKLTPDSGEHDRIRHQKAISEAKVKDALDYYRRGYYHENNTFQRAEVEHLLLKDYCTGWELPLDLSTTRRLRSR
jgi:hypothetical protein